MPNETLVALRDLGAIGIVTLAVLVLAITLYRLVKNAGDTDLQDRGILKQMIDLATSYKAESTDAREAYRQEAAATRAVVQESNDTQRQMSSALTQVVEATNIQTGEIRLLRSDFKNYQTLNADTITGFRDDLDAFKAEVITHLEALMKISEENQERHKKALLDRTEIHQKLDRIMDKLTNPPPPPVLVVTTPDTPPTGESADSELPKAV